MKHVKTLMSVVALGLILVMAWRIASLHMAELVFTKSLKPDTMDIEETLLWNSEHSEALVRRALTGQQGALDVELIHHLLNTRPYDGRLYAALAKQYSSDGNEGLASVTMQLAALMAPQRTDVQLDAASYWLRWGDLAKGLGFIDMALSKDTLSYKLLFPVILQLLEQPESSFLIEGMLRPERTWVAPFLVYALGNTKNFDLVRAVVARYESSQSETTQRVRDALVRRLQRENLWVDAYFDWLSFLSDEQIRHAGYVFNGDFEVSPLAGGFDWIIGKAQGVEAEINTAAGVGGSSALSVRFMGLKTPFKHVFQYMVLSPGAYSLLGKVKLDDLRAFKGVRWVVSCKEGGRTLGGTDTFVGQSGWRGFETTFSVPSAGCPVQLIRLELVGQVALDYQATGSVYFDELIIKRLAD